MDGKIETIGKPRDQSKEAQAPSESALSWSTIFPESSASGSRYSNLMGTSNSLDKTRDTKQNDNLDALVFAKMQESSGFFPNLELMQKSARERMEKNGLIKEPVKKPEEPARTAEVATVLAFTALAFALTRKAHPAIHIFGTAGGSAVGALGVTGYEKYFAKK